MSDICEREDHSLKSINFGASGKQCPYCRIAELEARLDAVRMLPEINMGFFIDGKPAPVVWVHDVKAALGGDDE